MSRKKQNRGRSRQRQSGKHHVPAKPQTFAPTVPMVESQPEPTKDASGADGENQSEAGQIQQTVARHVRVDTFFTAVIAAAAVIQGCVSYRQWEVMDSQNTIMRNQMAQTDATIEVMQNEQQAWIEIERPQLDDQVTAGVGVVFPIKNVGDTPAKITFVAVNLVGDNGIDHRKPIDEAAANPVSDFYRLVPGRIEFRIAPQKHEPYRAYNDALDVDKTFYVTCLVRYEDIYGKQHVATGSFEYFPGSKRFEVERRMGGQN